MTLLFMGWLLWSSSTQGSAPLSLYLDPQTVAAQKQKLTLVDLRPPAAFDQIFIPGSLNLSKAALKTKTWLASKHLVLINQGLEDLGEVREDLIEAGFSQVSILQGGLYGWHVAKLPLAGKAHAATEIPLLPAVRFFAQRDSQDWQVLKLHELESKQEAELAGQLHQAINRAKSGQSTLILDAAGELKGPILNLLLETGNTTFYYLEGGERAYKRFISTHRPPAYDPNCGCPKSNS